MSSSMQKYSPNNGAILTHKEHFQRFFYLLFFHEDHLDIVIKNILANTVLRLLPNFIDLVGDDPQSCWVKSNHPFLEFMYDIFPDLEIEQNILGMKKYTIDL